MFHIYYLRMNLSNLFLINQLGISSEYEQYKQHSSSRFQQRPRLILILVLIVVLNSHFSHPSHLSSSVPLWSSPLSPSITPTLFHLRLKPTFSTQTARHPTIWLFHPLLEVLNCWWLPSSFYVGIQAFSWNHQVPNDELSWDPVTFHAWHERCPSHLSHLHLIMPSNWGVQLPLWLSHLPLCPSRKCSGYFTAIYGVLLKFLHLGDWY